MEIKGRIVDEHRTLGRVWHHLHGIGCNAGNILHEFWQWDDGENRHWSRTEALREGNTIPDTGDGR